MRFALSRILQAIPALLGVTLVAFVLLHASGDAATMLLPPDATEEQRAELRERYGLNRPLPVQYLTYLGQLARGDFGQSFSDSRPALAVVLSHLPATLELTAAAMLIGLSLAIPIGIISAMRPHSFLGRLLMPLVMVGQSLPSFWLGMLLILALAVYFPIFPVSGRGGLDHLILPALTLASWPLTLVARLTRSGMLEVLSQDYIITARAKGLSERLIARRHALRNALPPVITVIGLNLGGMLGGAVMTETIFAWPGIGTLVLRSVMARDYPVVLATLILVAALFIAINLIVDVLYGYLDPRVKVAHGYR